MKRKNVFKILAAAAVFAIIGVNPSFAQKKEYTHKDELINNALISRTICKSSDDNSDFMQHIRKDYTYDEFDRIKTQCISRWNDRTNRWDKVMLYSYNYTGGFYSIELSRYLSGDDKLWAKIERSVYIIDDEQNLLLCQKYEWDKKDKGWILTDEMILKERIRFIIHT